MIPIMLNSTHLSLFHSNFLSTHHNSVKMKAYGFLLFMTRNTAVGIVLLEHGSTSIYLLHQAVRHETQIPLQNAIKKMIHL